MRYLRRRWEETRGHDFAEWGCSWWYFEVDDNLNVIRQIEVYDSGINLKYSETHADDEYGGLAEQPLDNEDWESYAITGAEFDRVWSTVQAMND
jgi:hypothetical protein